VVGVGAVLLSLVLGLLLSAIAGESVLRWLGLASGDVTAAALLLVSLRDRFGPRLARFRRLTDFALLGTAALVVGVGVGLVTRALAG
jgi:hypothetical protein